MKIILLIWTTGFAMLTANGCLQTGLNPFDYWKETIKNIISKLDVKANDYLVL